MHGRSISTPCAHLRQDLDGNGGRCPKTFSCAEKFSNSFHDPGRSPNATEKDETKFPRRNAFSLSALGKRIVSGLSFQKSHVQANSNEARSMVFKSTDASPSSDGFWRERDSSVRISEHFDSLNTKYISGASSFKGTSLRGLSYVASFNHENERSSCKGLSLEQAARVVSSSKITRKHCSPTGCDSPCDIFASFSDCSEDSGSLLLDPDILNNFAQALEQLPAPLDKATGTNDRNFSLNKTSSTENLFRQKVACERTSEKKEITVTKKIFEGLLGNPRLKKDTSSLKKLVCAITSEYHENSSTSELLERFPLLCPSGGERKVVLFYTSLGGIRTTYENCNNIRKALFGYRVKIDERDVSMHSDFKRELKDMLEKSVSLPRLFIKGRYIGGVEEILLLIEDGVMRKLLEDVPRTSAGACEGCADIRFVPCSECRGSCKIISYENKVVKCPRCNENGLVRCTFCC